MQILEVDLGPRSYSIFVGPGLMARSELAGAHATGRQVAVVTSENIASLYLARLRVALAGLDVLEILLPEGESHKNLDTCGRIFDALIEERFDRSCTLVALGGGVVGDMTGFAAACYQRGVGFIQVPTTLLAQVDSSVGGKTGVNHPRGKNMIGAFHQPLCVIADTDTLNSLSDRELRAGLAEVVKYGLIRDLEFLSWLEAHAKALLARDPNALTTAIVRSCHNKAEIVAEDERESGVRALLNLGHTFGHAIEAGCGYGTVLHGEAVALGIRMAADLSVRSGMLDDGDRQRLNRILDAFGLPNSVPAAMNPERFRQLMSVDKKVQDGRQRLVLLERLGRGMVTADVPPQLLNATLVAATQCGAT